MTTLESITKLEEALTDYYIQTEYLEAIQNGIEALKEKAEREEEKA